MNTNFDDIGRLTLDDSCVKLKPYIPREPITFQLMSDAELQQYIGDVLVVDTESYENYFLIAFKHLRTGKIIIFETPCNIFNNRKLAWIMQSYQTVGFNSIKYDLPIIWYSIVKNCNPDAIKLLSNALIFQNLFPQQAQKDFNFSIHRTNHIDLIEVCPLKGSLKLYGARLHASRIQDLPFVHDSILISEQIAIVRDYCINDLNTTELLYNNLSEQLALRVTLSQQYRQDLMSKSDAQIAEAIISSEIKQITGIWPKKPELGKIMMNELKYIVPSFINFQSPQLQKVLSTISNAKFATDSVGRLIVPDEIKGLQVQIGNGVYRLGIGGLHSSETNVSYKSNDEYELLDRDVASYYPRILLNQKLYPEHLGESFLQVYNDLVESRLTDKKEGRIAQSECKKIAINGTFGKTGSPYSVLYAPNITIQITLTGQLALLMLIEQLELLKIQVVSTNTDGILIYCAKNQKNKYLKIIKLWEQITGFTTEETRYEAIYSRDVNAYLAVKKDDKDVKVSFKGKNNYYDPWRGKTGKDQYWKFQKNPTTQICIEAIENLIGQQIPIEQTIKSCQDITKFVVVKNVTGGAHKDGYYLGKVVRWIYGKNVYGTINYIKNNDKVPESEGAFPLMDLPESFPGTLIDYEWYIKRTVEMLTEINYYQKAKQYSFF
jgi:hypothetical protein